MIKTTCGPIEYTEFGDGSPVLIAHGAGGGYDQGEYFARLIGGNYHWIAPSRFGFLGTPIFRARPANLVRSIRAPQALMPDLGKATKQ